jgi:type VI secretion system VasD/TssJ family lipoprotein
MNLLLKVFLTGNLIASCAVHSLTGALPVHAAESPSMKGRALLIGINKYQNLPSLRGSVNDVEAIRQLLVTRYGFARESVHVLLDQEATRQGIVDALTKLCQHAGVDETVYVHYSGYGSLIKLYQDNKEPLIRESLVPFDGRAGTTPDLLVEDIQRSLDKITSKAVVFVTDAAYSVTTSRAGKVLTRAIAADTRPKLYANTLSERGAPARSSAQVWLAAAGLQQAALDAPVDGKYYGLFSYALTRSLASNKSSAATQDIFAGVERELRRVQTQLGLTSLPEPRLIATAERVAGPLFYVAKLPSQPVGTEPRLAYVDVDPQGTDRVLLLNGVGLGASVGSSWAIYPPKETEFPPGQALAIAMVIEAQGNNALARVEPATMTVERGSRAVLVAPPAPNSVPIRLHNMAPDREQNLKAALQQKMPHLTFVGKEEFARYVIDEQGEMVFIAGADGMNTVGAIPVSNEAMLAGNLASMLSRSTNASALVSLDNPSSKIQISASVASDATARGVTLSSSELLNPDRNGKPLSVVVRLYQLSGKDKFEQATYQSLQKGDLKVLEGELVSRSEVTLHPNSQEVIKIAPAKNANYIGIMAMFRDPQAQRWRQIIPVREVAAQSLDVAFEGSGILGVSRETLLARRGVKLVANTSASRVRIKKPNDPRTAENSLQLAVRANCDCYITIIDVDAEGGINLLFPNDAQGVKFYPKGKVRSGETVLIPDSLHEDNHAGFHFDYSTPPGIDTVRIFASTDLETAEMIRRYAKNPTQVPAPKTLEAGESGSPPIVVASATLDELKSGLRTRGVRVTKSQPQSQSTGVHPAAAGAPGHGKGVVLPVSFQGSDWTAISVTVVVDP